MTKRPGLAKSELEVAQIVWRLGKASVRQVLDALPAKRNLDFKTVQTYLRRLEAKGYLRTRMEGRSKIYFPQVRPDQVIREVLNDLVHRLFGGDSIPVFQHLIQDRGLTKEEVGQLRTMLDQAEEKQP